MAAVLPEQVGLGRDDEVGGRLVAGDVEAAHDGDRDAVELAEDELRRSGDLVGEGDARRVELVARGILLAVEDAERLDAGGADRDVGRARAPRPAERVGDDDADGLAGALAQLVAQPRRGRVGVERKQDERLRLGRVRRVDAGRAADEAVPRARDEERRAGADELDRFVEDDLDAARVGVGGELARLLRRLDVRERDDAPFDLRDRLLRDDDDIAVLEVDALDDRAGEVVSLAQLGQAGDGRDGEAGPDLLDENQRRIALVPQPVQLLESDEADGRVEGAWRGRSRGRAATDRASSPGGSGRRCSRHQRSAAPTSARPDAAAMLRRGARR